MKINKLHGTIIIKIIKINKLHGIILRIDYMIK